MKEKKDSLSYVGKTFNRLTVLRKTKEKNNSRSFYWLFRCICGKEVKSVLCAVKNGKTKSCGCSRIGASHYGKSRKHGFSHKERLYSCWIAIRSRCCNTKNKNYVNYGARGIRLYQPWIEDYLVFKRYVTKLNHFPQEYLEKSGHRSSLLRTLDRIDNNKGYFPGNLKWSTNREQATNKQHNVHVVYKGKTVLLIDLCENLNLDRRKINARLHCGWSIEEALNCSKRSRRDKLCLSNSNSEDQTKIANIIRRRRERIRVFQMIALQRLHRLSRRG